MVQKHITLPRFSVAPPGLRLFLTAGAFCPSCFDPRYYCPATLPHQPFSRLWSVFVTSAAITIPVSWSTTLTPQLRSATFPRLSILNLPCSRPPDACPPSPSPDESSKGNLCHALFSRPCQVTMQVYGAIAKGNNNRDMNPDNRITNS
jgi:hypothetical protein